MCQKCKIKAVDSFVGLYYFSMALSWSFEISSSDTWALATEPLFNLSTSQ